MTYLPTFRALGLALLTLGFSSAAYAGKSRPKIAFTSEPSGVEVHVQKYNFVDVKKEGQTCITPCAMKLKAKKVYTFRINRDGVESGKVSHILKYEDGGLSVLDSALDEMDVAMSANGEFRITFRSDEDIAAIRAEKKAKADAREKAYEDRMIKRKIMQEKVLIARSDPRPANCSNAPSPSPDKDAKGALRLPGAIPPEALFKGKSGHCLMRFNVTPAGRPVDIEVVSCSDKIFKKNSVSAVERWYFEPKIENNQAVSFCGVETKVDYVLMNEKGEKIP